MKILIAGAAGTLGRPLAQQLLRAGHEVWGTTRGRTDALRTAGVRPVVVDVLDASATERAVGGAAPDAIVQVLNALPPGGPMRSEDLLETNRLRIEGTANLVAAARAGGVARYVAESFIFVYGSRPVGSPPLTEDAPPASGPGGGMQPAIDALAALERQVLSLDGIVLRCGLFYGAGVPSTDALAARVRRRAMPVFGFAGVVPWLHIDDAASAFVAAIESSRRGRVYNIAGEPASFADMVRELAAATKAKPPRRLPRIAARLAGPYVAAMLASNLTVATGRAREELGWTPASPTIGDGLRRTAAR